LSDILSVGHPNISVVSDILSVGQPSFSVFSGKLSVVGIPPVSKNSGAKLTINPKQPKYPGVQPILYPTTFFKYIEIKFLLFLHVFSFISNEFYNNKSVA